MPAIFDEKARREVHEALLCAGLTIVLEKGIDQLTISEVTQRAGRGKGTFYHFFSSKEVFLQEVLQRGRKNIADELEKAAVEMGGTLDRKGLQQWLKTAWNIGGAFYRSVGQTGLILLNNNSPIDQKNDVSIAEVDKAWIASRVVGISPQANWKVFSNIQSALALLYLHAKHLHEDALEATVDALIAAECQCLFDS